MLPPPKPVRKIWITDFEAVNILAVVDFLGFLARELSNRNRQLYQSQ